MRQRREESDDYRDQSAQSLDNERRERQAEVKPWRRVEPVAV